MNFEFSDEQIQLRNEARRFLEAKCPPSAVRVVLDGTEPFDRQLWTGLAEMGFLGVAIPEEYGGLGAGYLGLCVIAEELGRVLAPVPFSSSVFLAAEFLLLGGSEAQKAAWLPKLAAGETIGCLALVDPTETATAGNVATRVVKGRLTGCKVPVADGDIADFAIVAARTTPDDSVPDIALFIVDLHAPGVVRETIKTIDPTRSHARLTFEGAQAEPLGDATAGLSILRDVYDRAAVLTAFEQIGGADRSLEMARDYALGRMAFGRPIGSFQAIKHMLANMYVSVTLARSNAYFGAWALSTGSSELPVAAATARVSATQAFLHCAKDNIQVPGGMGFTWEFECHLFYRRANLLALNLGPLSQWEQKLIERLHARRDLMAETSR